MSSICSGELMNKKFLVPCNTLDILESNYERSEWREVKKNHYSIPNKLDVGFWSLNDSEYKYYDIKGKYMKRRTDEDLKAFRKENY